MVVRMYVKQQENLSFKREGEGRQGVSCKGTTFS